MNSKLYLPIKYLRGKAIAFLAMVLLALTAQEISFAKETVSTGKKLPQLHAIEPTLDKTSPSSLKKLLKGAVRDTYNPSMIAIPKSGSTNAYQAGLYLFKQGDYNRALFAFQTALTRAQKYGTADDRYKRALKAINSTAPYLTERAKLGYETNNKNRNELTGVVTKTFPPSLAWLGGLKKNDRVLSSSKNKNRVFLKVQRGSKTYGLTLRLDQKASHENLKLQTGKTDTYTSDGYFKGTIRHPEYLEKEKRRLAGYDCILMLDCSGSMGDRIVSLGRRNGRMTTRWNWCKEQMLNLFGEGSQYFPEGITLVPFANRFAIINEARAKGVREMFQQLSPVGGTNMAQPLAFLIDNYFTRKDRANSKVKPIVIAILSDGEGNAHLLRQVIINATRRMTRPREIIITFLAVDASDIGRPVIEAMDCNLTSAGAKYDIVDSRSFEELNRYGLLKMLVAALIEPYVEGS